MRKLVRLAAAISLALTMLASQSVVANAATTIVGTIDGGGTSIMTDGMGDTTFSIHATLFWEARLEVNITCVDRMGSARDIREHLRCVTSWSRNVDGTINLYVTDGKFVSFRNGLVFPGGVPFTLTIQAYGGAGVGHWTLAVPGTSSPNGGPICQELLTSGRLVAKWN